MVHGALHRHWVALCCAGFMAGPWLQQQRVPAEMCTGRTLFIAGGVGGAWGPMPFTTCVALFPFYKCMRLRPNWAWDHHVNGAALNSFP